MSNYLVTGAFGFIGSHFVNKMLNENHRIIGIDSMSTDSDFSLKQERLHFLNASRYLEYRSKIQKFIFVGLDLSYSSCIEKLGQLNEETKIDAVIHLAGSAGVRRSNEEPAKYIRNNVMSTVNCLEFCRKFSIPKFVLASTSSIYSGAKMVPFMEHDQIDNMLSVYAESKKMAEDVCSTYNRFHGIDISILRFFTVYGEKGRPDMSISKFIECISNNKELVMYGDGSQSRDYTHVQDICEGIQKALIPVGCEIFNLGKDEPVSVKDIISKLEGIIGKKAIVRSEPRHSSDIDCTNADISKAKRILGWEPKISIDAGLKRVWEYTQ
jgi:UDP-glucuronate 4-epimerase